MNPLFVLKIYVFLLLSFFFIYTVGSFFNSFFLQKRTTYELFQKLTIGLITVVSAYAIYNTSGKTILLLNFLLGGGLILYNKKQINLKFFKKRIRIDKEVKYVVIALTILYVLQLNTMFSIFNGDVKLINPDYSFYSRLSEYLNISGNENSTIDYFLSSNDSVSPYHFFDLWLAAMVYNFFTSIPNML